MPCIPPRCQSDVYTARNGASRRAGSHVRQRETDVRRLRVTINDLALAPSWVAFRQGLLGHLQQVSQRPSRGNLSPTARRALGDLKQRRDIVVVPSDKCKGLVVQHTGEYLQACMGLLSDNTIYKALGPVYPTGTHTKETPVLLALQVKVNSIRSGLQPFVRRVLLEGGIRDPFVREYYTQVRVVY